MDIRTLLAFGTGVGIEIRERDLAVAISHVRPNGVRIAGSTVIQNFRERPAGEWGSEYLKFLREHRREPSGGDGGGAEAGSDRAAGGASGSCE